jgi:hypothetical protein
MRSKVVWVTMSNNCSPDSAGMVQIKVEKTGIFHLFKRTNPAKRLTGLTAALQYRPA